MAFDPVAVPKSEGAAATAPAKEPPPSAATAKEPPPSAAAPVVRGFQFNGLHVVLFAAGGEGPGYDGLIFERTSPAPSTAKPKANAKAATAAPPPGH
jgi:hypothetical protein